MSDVALWRAVVAQAFEDACNPCRMKDRSQREVSLRDRQEARSWLLRDRRDFVDVCHMGQLDPEAIRDEAEKLDDRDWSGRSHIRPGRKYLYA